MEERGAGKSSTINALFEQEVSTVGNTFLPETMEIQEYDMKEIILWDTPGLGDGPKADEIHTEKIIKKLKEVDINGQQLIDNVVVVIDGRTRDLGSVYKLINEVVVPNLPNAENRMVIAVNKIDEILSGVHWKEDTNEPDLELIAYLEEMMNKISQRLLEDTGIEFNPIYYKAGKTLEDGRQEKPYNMSKVLFNIVKKTPSNKQLCYVNQINKESAVWEDDDNKEKYNENTITNIVDGVEKTIEEIIDETATEYFPKFVREVVKRAKQIIPKVIKSLKNF